MTTKLLLLLAGATPVFAQTQSDALQKMLTSYQQIGGGVLPAAGGRGALGSGRAFPGKEGPFSAHEERHTTQTLSDGTLIESSQTALLYRDAQGRTRVEQTVDNRTTVTIVDPVAGVRLVIDPAAKTATKINMPAPAITAEQKLIQAQVLRFEGNGAVTAAGAGPPGTAAEDLGQSMQNGVLAQGTRTTVTIPRGQIGNNRDIRVVNERWYSKELQMLVRSMNNDPRFGVTTYELTNISQTPPDTALFQVPAGYTVSEVAGRGGRGTVSPGGGPVGAGARGGR